MCLLMNYCIFQVNRILYVLYSLQGKNIVLYDSFEYYKIVVLYKIVFNVFLVCNCGYFNIFKVLDFNFMIE